jgi:nucleotide-binding universal stress UspA family protein
MFRRLLLPLDGSKRAERAIPVAARIAHASGGSLMLLRAAGTHIEFGTYITEPSVLIQEAFETDLTRAVDYLARIKASGDLAGIETTVAVRSGEAAQTILDVAQTQHVDLICENIPEQSCGPPTERPTSRPQADDCLLGSDGARCCQRSSQRC